MKKNEIDVHKRRLIIYLILSVVFLSGIILLFAAENLPESYQPAAHAVGGFLSIAIAVEFLYHVTLRKMDDEERKDEMRELFCKMKWND